VVGLDFALKIAMPLLIKRGGTIGEFVVKFDELGQEAIKGAAAIVVKVDKVQTKAMAKAKVAKPKKPAKKPTKPKPGKFTPPAWIANANAMFLRRGLDQLLQEFVMVHPISTNNYFDTFDALFDRFDALNYPLNFVIPTTRVHISITRASRAQLTVIVGPG
jgi:hypothetical protein